MLRKNYQSGFAFALPIIIVAIILLIVAGFNTGRISLGQPTQPQPTVLATPSPTIPSRLSYPKSTSPNPAPSPSPKPTTTSQPGSSNITNPYDLNSPTGSVKVLVKPQSGDLGFTPQAELSTVSGFKVLDGRSTDKITRFGPNRTDNLRGEIIFSTAPPGPYKVRISYNGVWGDQKDLSVKSAEQTVVEFTVAGVTPTPTPAPTPKPKPVCSVLVIPSNSGTAPYQASVCVGNNSNPDQGVQQEFADYDGDGSWDYQGPQYGCHSYTFQSPGTYQPKAKIIGTSGEESDICQTSVTVN